MIFTFQRTYQDIANQNIAVLSEVYPSFKVFSHDPRLYKKDAAQEVKLNNEEVLYYLGGSNIEASDLCMLIKAEEELAQTLNFIRIFPSDSTTR